MALTEEQEKHLAALGEQYGKIGHVEHDGHLLAFRCPNRIQVREYRRKDDSPTERPERVDQLLQQMCVYVDGETDLVRVMQSFSVFLDANPMFGDGPRAQTIISVLAGIIEEGSSSHLGKGCRIWRRGTKTSPTSSPSGSLATPTTPAPSAPS